MQLITLHQHRSETIKGIVRHDLWVIRWLLTSVPMPELFWCSKIGVKHSFWCLTQFSSYLFSVRKPTKDGCMEAWGWKPNLLPSPWCGAGLGIVGTPMARCRASMLSPSLICSILGTEVSANRKKKGWVTYPGGAHVITTTQSSGLARSWSHWVTQHTIWDNNMGPGYVLGLIKGIFNSVKLQSSTTLASCCSLGPL